MKLRACVALSYVHRRPPFPMAIDLMGMDFNFSFIPYGETFIYKTSFVSLTAASCAL